MIPLSADLAVAGAIRGTTSQPGQTTSYSLPGRSSSATCTASLFGPEHFAQRVAPKPEPRGKTYGIGELSRRMGRRSTSQMRTWIAGAAWLPDSTHATGTGMAMRRAGP